MLATQEVRWNSHPKDHLNSSDQASTFYGAERGRGKSLCAEHVECTGYASHRF